MNLAALYGIIASSHQSAVSYNSAVLADSPYNFWPLNSTSGRSDLGSHGNDMANSLHLITITSTGGPFGDGYANASSSNYGYTVSQQNPSTTNFTNEAWINVSASSITGYIVGQSSGDNRHDIYLSSGALYSPYSTFNTGYSPSSGTWTHIATTWDGTTQRFYVNGVQNATTTTVPAGDAMAFMAIGRDQNDSNQLSAAVGVARVAVYATCLSAARILVHATATKP